LLEAIRLKRSDIVLILDHALLVDFEVLSILRTENYVPADPRLFDLSAGNKWGWLMSTSPAIPVPDTMILTISRRRKVLVAFAGAWVFCYDDKTGRWNDAVPEGWDLRQLLPAVRI
jgi:hypothetical protein